MLCMEIQKSHIRTINLKYQLQHGMKNLNNLIDHILHQMFKIILNIYKKKVWGKTVNPSIIKYINKVENRITFKIKTGYYLELLTPETVKLLGSYLQKIKSTCKRWKWWKCSLFTNYRSDISAL